MIDTYSDYEEYLLLYQEVSLKMLMIALHLIKAVTKGW